MINKTNQSKLQQELISAANAFEASKRKLFAAQGTMEAAGERYVKARIAVTDEANASLAASKQLPYGA